MATFIGAPTAPLPASISMTDAERRLVALTVSLLIDYPHEDTWHDRRTAIDEAFDELPAAVQPSVRTFLDSTAALGQRGTAEHYVATFDQRRRCTLSLTYFTYGDTRARGEALVAVKQLLADAGYELTSDELPDYLPVVLEFAARCDDDTGFHLLQAHREGLEVVASALRQLDSPYQHLLQALAYALPEPDADTIAHYQRLVQSGPPTELVGRTRHTPLPCEGGPRGHA